MQDAQGSILAQYANSPTITTIVDFINQWIDPTADLDSFYSVIWNVQTASGFGLDVWGRIVDVPRQLLVPSTPAYLGFDEAFTSATSASGPQPFNQSPMYAGPLASAAYSLSDDAYRKLIMVKAMANITDCTSPSINALLTYMFAGRGRAYVNDTGSMTIRYVFEFILTPVELAILTNSKAIPRPAGVQVSILQLDVSNSFGFANTGLQPFGQGSFFTSQGLQNAN